MRIELVTTLKRKATEIISSLDQDRNPVLITQYGKPVAYLVDVVTPQLRRYGHTVKHSLAYSLPWCRLFSYAGCYA